MKKRQITLLAGAALLALGIAFVLTRSREPSHLGLTVSQWLDKLETGHSGDRRAAREALHAMGSNAAPFLIAMIAARDSSLKARLARQSILKYSYRPPSTRLRVVLEALGELNRPNAPADPALIELLNRPDRALTALGGFMALGVEDKAVYERALLHSNAGVRQTAAVALSRIQDGKRMRFTGMFTYGEPSPTGGFPRVVAGFGPSSRAEITPSAIVSILVDCATDPNPKTRLAAIQAFADFGMMFPADAEPALKAALTDNDSAVRRAATNALAKVIKPR